MKIIYSIGFKPASEEEANLVYNGMDSALTLEIFSKIHPLLDEVTSKTYSFLRAMQGPALELDLRGLLVDSVTKSEVAYDLELQASRLDRILQRLAEAVWDRGLNPNSPQQLQAFFYGHMKIPPVVISQKGERKVSTNREALEKLQLYFYARPFVNLILALRDARKKLSVLRKGVDSDGRMRTSYNIAGTDTGRWSSSSSAFGTGDNMQNQTDKLREIYICEPGWKLGYADLSGAESRGVGYLSGDTAFIAACESGDAHTYVAKLVWPKLPWTGNLKHDKKEVAGKPFYREMSFRDMAKRGGHGTNYLGTPWTMARHLKVSKETVQQFQDQYFAAFPGIKRWHLETQRQLQIQGFLTTPMGRRRFFFGRRDADETLRAAVAYGPQSTIGDILNYGLYKVWHSSHFGVLQGKVKILAQVHDAILFQYKEEEEAVILPLVLSLMEIRVPVNGRTMLIPPEVSVGWNWRKYLSEQDAAKQETRANIYGIREWTGKDDRTRPAQKQAVSLLDRRIL